MLRKLHIKRIYRSKYNNLSKEFIIPVLRESKLYYRASGYFSISALVELMDGLIPFIKNGGNIKLVTSIQLSDQDRKIIQDGLEIGQRTAISIIEKEIEEAIVNHIESMKLDIITNLIALNRIEIKIAYMPKDGIYHEKIGLLEDDEGDIIYFTGSTNETYNAYFRNMENITVLKSWTEDYEDIVEEKTYFKSLWNDKVPYLKVFTFTKALKEKLFEKYKLSGQLNEAIETYECSILNSDNKSGKCRKQLYSYQKIAIQQFIDNDYCHFYQMATGTGKTFTAIKSIEVLNEKYKNLFVMILVPKIDLLIQWNQDLKEQGYESYLFGGGLTKDDWSTTFSKCTIDYCIEEKMVVCISTYDTFFSNLYKKVNAFEANFIIVDESHNLSPNQIKKLPTTFKNRLGLSATPERHKILETEDIINYFTQGRIDTYKYTIEEAIENEFLSRYNYYPLYVHLTEDEFELYKKYTMQIIMLMSKEIKDEDAIVKARRERSLIVKRANNKLQCLSNMIHSKKYNFNNSVIYCGQGKDIQTEENLIDFVTGLLSKDGGYKISQYTSKTIERNKVLREFENGYYDILAAIKCFDEGVDVPKLDKIYIMSSDSLLRQTIQRRGRVLRKCKETGKKIAYIYDMVVLPPKGMHKGNIVKSLVSNEFIRVKEYMRLSENRDIEIEKLSDLEFVYGVEGDEHEGY
ncbi:DEAD/DEAH box helicase family protein [Terrisporobacter sp.]